MCGRYAASANPDELVETYEIDEVTPDGREASRPRFNLAPTDSLPAILERTRDDETARTLVGLRWGLVPSWSKDASGAARMINARAETVAEKPAYRKAFRARRCLLPALGYYEWRPWRVGGATVKQPWFLRPGDGSTLMMAGIYELWKAPDGWLPTVSIITTTATDEVGWVHDRMPMTVRDVDAWLDPALDDAETALALLAAPSGMTSVAVSRAVNSVRNDGPHLVEPIALEGSPVE